MNLTKSFTTIVGILIVVSLISCSKLRKSWTKEGYEGKSFPRLAILVLNPDKTERKSFEDLIVSTLNSNGIQVVGNIDLFAPAENLDSYIERQIDELQLDGILTVALIWSGDEQFIAPENYNKFSKFYAHRFTGLNTPQYLAKQSKYVMEGVLHDLTGVDEIVWRGEMGLLDPESLSAKKRFLTRMMNQLIDDGLIRNTESRPDSL